MIDASCTVWQDECGETGSCWVYDNFEMSVRLLGLMVIFKVLSLTFTSLALKLYKPPKVQQSHELDNS